jgi:N-hydroxyarylamine O-acetyltransferase
VFVHRRGWQRQLLPGCWDIVGGHVEAGESLVDALAREVEEETGWQLVGTPRLMFLADWETSDGGRVDRRREFDFLVDVDGDLSRPRLEWPKHVESTWVGHTDLALLDENRGVDDGLVRQLVTSAHYWPRSDRPSHPHVTLFLRGPAADGLERVRHRGDPVMADAIHVHVTIAYPQAVAQVEEMIDRTRRAAASIGPVQLRLGEVDHDDDAAWLFVHVEDVRPGRVTCRCTVLGVAGHAQSMTSRGSPMAPSTPRLNPAVVAAYLDRVRHPPVNSPTLAALTTLQDAHVRTVPFENLDIHLGQPLSLEQDDLVRKVVQNRRGGFCFELNGLFHALLTSLGFQATLVEARTFEEGHLGPRFDHARILVDLDGDTLLVDVGTGASPRGPIRLNEDAQQVGVSTYRVISMQGRLVSQALVDGQWTSGWSFDTVARGLEDFADRCTYHQTSSESHFTQKPLCTLVTESGHITLSDLTLITTAHGHRHEELVDDPLAVLQSRFGVTLPRWPGW